MPIISNSYYENICFEQSQFDPFENCSTIKEILTCYRQMIWTEHLAGKDSAEPEYFLEHLKIADDLIQFWNESHDEEMFLQKAAKSEHFEIAEIIISSNLCDLCF